MCKAAFIDLDGLAIILIMIVFAQLPPPERKSQVSRMHDPEITQFVASIINDIAKYMSTDDLKAIQKTADQNEDNTTGKEKQFHGAIVAAIQNYTQSD
ncbi:hypothetical protein B0T16DRAFT_459833 [Cercophora newfieldiana]|uniref:Uncharacterized protein n=1 Tax=Cercophora newfieldiana TaxID=92897 RepID=A0AA39Y2K3_9PEZI|nr:hypothetical protein B0T16DRAFT_459833 [Cercophora newfieldiana]